MSKQYCDYLEQYFDSTIESENTSNHCLVIIYLLLRFFISICKSLDSEK